MNTTQTNTIHIKIEHKDEFRRFSLVEPTFDSLIATLRKSFGLLGSIPLTVKFLDDEEDWVVISSDQELLYAVELNGSPLRLSMKASDEPVNTDIPKRGGMRGGRGKALGGVSPKERLAGKRTRLSNRIANLELQLKSPDLKSERQRVLLWRLQSLQSKLNAVIEKQHAFGDVEPNSSATTTSPDVEEIAPHVACEGPFHGRGGHRGRGGRGGRGARFAVHHHANNATGTDLSHFRQCKLNLRAARQSRNPESIQAAKQALGEAKAQMKANPELAHLSELREKKKTCFAALRAAQQANNNEAEIKACKEALAEAIQQLRDAKKHA